MSKPTVLVCDDEENIRKGVKLILEREYDLVFAVDGEECLKQLNSRAFDLVILDIKLPKVNGLDILNQLTARPAHPPVIMLTAYHSMPVAQRASESGAVDYVTKPFQRKALLKAVDRALQMKPWQTPGPKEPPAA